MNDRSTGMDDRNERGFLKRGDPSDVLIARARAHRGDHVNHPAHYTSHPSGVECLTVAEHMNFCLGNALKYIWRADFKGDAVEDLKKARFYLDREIARRSASIGSSDVS